MKANCKRLKATLVLGVRKLSSLLLALKLGEFPLLDKIFFDLDDF